MSDLESQRDELEALQSIYNSDEFKANDGHGSGQPGGQFFAHLELPPDFKVVYKLLSARSNPHHEKKDDGASSKSEVESFNIEFLPPVVLYFTFPSNYPSKEKPNYLLSCKWLTRGKLSILCRHLDQLWEENKRMEILFIWTQFLKEEAVKKLNINTTLDISAIYTKQISYLEKMRKRQVFDKLQRIESQASSTRERNEGRDQKCQIKFGDTTSQVYMNVRTGQQRCGPNSCSQQLPSSYSLEVEANIKDEGMAGQSNLVCVQGSRVATALTEDTSRQYNNRNQFRRNAHKSNSWQTSTNQLPSESSRRNQSRPSKSSKQHSYDKSGEKDKIPHCEDSTQNFARGFTPDERTVCDLPLTEPVCLMLQQFNQDQRVVVFSRTFQECNVCFSSKPGSECIQFDKCGHIFCKACIGGYFEVQVRDGNVMLLKCLEDKCDAEATPSQVKQVLSAETFAKYDAALLAATLDTMSDIVYCPRRQCQYPVTLEPEESMGRCPSCHYVFCIYCKMVYHGVEPCRLKTEEQLRLVNDYNTGSSDTRHLLEKRYGRRQLQRLVDTVLSEQWVSTNSQNCPNCNVSIEKSSGCNKMVCWKCNTYFCWLCQAVLSHATPYLHFNNPISRCFNRLFEGVDVHEDEDEDDDFWLDFEEL